VYHFTTNTNTNLPRRHQSFAFAGRRVNQTIQPTRAGDSSPAQAYIRLDNRRASTNKNAPNRLQRFEANHMPLGGTMAIETVAAPEFIETHEIFNRAMTLREKPLTHQELRQQARKIAREISELSFEADMHLSDDTFGFIDHECLCRLSESASDVQTLLDAFVLEHRLACEHRAERTKELRVVRAYRRGLASDAKGTPPAPAMLAR
jgi:hypothetical protein